MAFKSCVAQATGAGTSAFNLISSLQCCCSLGLPLWAACYSHAATTSLWRNEAATPQHMCFRWGIGPRALAGSGHVRSVLADDIPPAASIREHGVLCRIVGRSAGNTRCCTAASVSDVLLVYAHSRTTAFPEHIVLVVFLHAFVSGLEVPDKTHWATGAHSEEMVWA